MTAVRLGSRRGVGDLVARVDDREPPGFPRPCGRRFPFRRCSRGPPRRSPSSRFSVLPMSSISLAIAARSASATRPSRDSAACSMSRRRSRHRVGSARRAWVIRRPAHALSICSLQPIPRPCAVSGSFGGVIASASEAIHEPRFQPAEGSPRPSLCRVLAITAPIGFRRRRASVFAATPTSRPASPADIDARICRTPPQEADLPLDESDRSEGLDVPIYPSKSRPRSAPARGCDRGHGEGGEQLVPLSVMRDASADHETNVTLSSFSTRSPRRDASGRDPSGGVPKVSADDDLFLHFRLLMASTSEENCSSNRSIDEETASCSLEWRRSPCPRRHRSPAPASDDDVNKTIFEAMSRWWRRSWEAPYDDLDESAIWVNHTFPDRHPPSRWPQRHQRMMASTAIEGSPSSAAPAVASAIDRRLEAFRIDRLSGQRVS